MSERYTRLFTLPEENLYTIGSPIIICAGALLKDTLTGSIIAQLKFRNIGKRTISALQISLRTFDVFGKELEGITEYQYLDLAVVRDQEFGQKTPVILPNPDTRSFYCDCHSIVFVDGSVWEAKNANWLPLKKQESLQSRFGDLTSQYQRDIRDSEARFVATKDRDLWLCTCGAINNSEEAICHSCKAKLEVLKTAEDKTLLNEHLQEYLQKEEQARLETERRAEIARAEEAQKAEEEHKKEEQCKKKYRKIAVAFGAITMLVTAIIIVYFSVIRPAIEYNNAISLYENEEYEDAIAAFERLSTYKNSAALAIDSKYNLALLLYSKGQYEDAIVFFRELNDYKDSQTQLSACFDGANERDYQKALQLLEQKDFESAILVFKSLYGYKDSTAQISFCEEGLWKEDLRSKLYYGNVIKLGQYYERAYSSKKSDLWWVVLRTDGTKALLITKYVIDCQPYSSETVLWEDSSIRQWLNGDFYYDAFSNKRERDLIIDTTLENSKSTTKDKVFFLSVSEAKEYFDRNDDRSCWATKYAEANGAENYSYYDSNFNSRNAAGWWLRSRYSSDAVSYIHPSGAIDYSKVDNKHIGVRPVIWIDIG